MQILPGVPPQAPPPKPSIALPDDVWRGLFADYRDLVSGTTEAPDIYHFGIFAFVLGVTLARRIWLNYARPIYPNFYICEVGTSALTRKGTAWGRGLDILRRLHVQPPGQQPPTLTIVPGVGSAEGLLDCLEGDRRVLVVSEEEFRSLLTKAKQEALSNLIPKLTALFDCPDVETLITRKNTVIANEPFVAIVTGTTKEWLERSLLESDIHGGFANRFIYLIGEPKSPMAFPPKINANRRDEIVQKINEIRLWAEGIEQSPSKGEIILSPDAIAVFEPYYAENYSQSNQDSVASNLIRRMPLHAMKLALLYAALDKSMEIKKEHMEAAIAAIRIFERLCYWHLCGFRRFQKVTTREKSIAFAHSA